MLRKINLLYVAIPFLLWGLWGIFKSISRSTASFYGFAENKETSINLDHALTVHKLHIKPGQFVKKGELMMEVSRISLDIKMNELSSNIAQIESANTWREAEIRSRMEEVRSEKAEKMGVIQAAIRVAESEIALNKRLINDLKTVQIKDSSANNPAQAKLNALREELRLAAEPFDKELAALEKELKLSGLSEQKEASHLKNEMTFYQKEQGRLLIKAPSDGLIGEIHCKEGQNMDAFDALISFYEECPNMVVGYVHESLSLKINIGDSLRVVSSLHPAEQTGGRIVGLGHRIVEIPERLRKIPELRTYGREVMIEIPSNNKFLQKEKVILQWSSDVISPFQSVLSQQTSH
jgi:multidrug resistance efflux pump